MIRITWNIGRVALIVFCGWLLLHASEERARAARMTSMIVAELKSPDEHMISERLRFVTDLLNKGTDPQILSSAALVLLVLVPYARRKTNTEPK